MPQSERDYTTWLLEAKRLRTEEAEATVDFFRHLEIGERDVAMWAHTGKPTFLALITSENLCAPERYAAAQSAAARWGWDQVRQHGVDAVKAVLTVPAEAVARHSPTERAAEAIFREFAAFEARNRTPVSERHSRAIVRKFYEPPPPQPRVVSTAEARIEALEAENKALRLENKRLRAENARLMSGKGTRRRAQSEHVSS